MKFHWMTHWHKREECQRTVNEFHLVCIAKSGLHQTGVSRVGLSERERDSFLWLHPHIFDVKTALFRLRYVHCGLLIYPGSSLSFTTIPKNLKMAPGSSSGYGTQSFMIRPLIAHFASLRENSCSLTAKPIQTFLCGPEHHHTDVHILKKKKKAKGDQSMAVCLLQR